jgi:bifunctional DNA-binding transcriptional regulator/antitoxin component of YhaV-PrlF toxin-antitoxin module
MGNSTRVTDKWQATIPENLCEKYDREPGDEVIWIDTEEGMLIKKRTQNRDCGILLRNDSPQERRQEVANELIKRVRDC